MPKSLKSYTFDFTKQFSSGTLPKLSIHETGRVHVYSPEKPENRTEPIFITALPELRGAHVATVTVNNFNSLQKSWKSLKASGKEQDVVIKTDDIVESGRFAIYGNSEKPDFPTKCWITVNMPAPHLSSPFFVGIAAYPQFPLGDVGQLGAIVISGWDPMKEPDAVNDFVYICAK